jgi:subtilisin
MRFSRWATITLPVLVMLAACVPGADPAKPRNDEGAQARIPDGEAAPLEVFAPADLAAETADWGHAVIGVPEAWKATKGKGATVAVLDTGIDSTHPEFAGRVKETKNFTRSRAGSEDVNGHGTHCAGIVAAGENGFGVVGVAPEAELLVAKVLGDRGSGSLAWVAAGIDWAVENGADVISMSLSAGPDADDRNVRAAIRRATDKGVIVIAAAGNGGVTEYPAKFPEVVCVGAIDDRKRLASFSGRGPEVAVVAPGVRVRSAYSAGRYATLSGTSMATPYVAGCAALYVAKCRATGVAPSAAAFRKLIEQTSADLGPTGRDDSFGWGLVQPAKLLPPGGPAPPRTITFGRDDFSPAGWQKLQQAMPGLRRVTLEFESGAGPAPGGKARPK